MVLIITIGSGLGFLSGSNSYIFSITNNFTKVDLNFKESDFVPGNELRVIQAYQHSLNERDYNLYKSVVGQFGVINKFTDSNNFHEISTSITSMKKIGGGMVIIYDNNNCKHSLIRLGDRLYYREDFTAK